MSAILQVDSLSKSYGSLRAVAGVSFDVIRGEIFGFLGPNGAGKTTCLEMMEGLRRPDSGSVILEGIPVWPDPERIRGLIGVQSQSTSFYEELTAQEILRLFASLHGRKMTSQVVDDLLEMGGLIEKRNAHTITLSGGQKQRLAILVALVNEPGILFLDEPTTGLDPQARRRCWEVIKELQAKGKTVILSTHYMEEAEFLCDRVAIIDHGRIIALDTPHRLIEQFGATHGKEIAMKEPRASAANLEDVFLALTGKELRD